jgi:hypothetical protein
VNSCIDKVKFKHSESPLAESEIMELEKILEIKFPKPVYALYLRTNGGEPSHYLFDPLDTSISEFMPLTASDPEITAVACYKDLVLEQELVPRNLFPFAVDSCGDYFFVDTKSADGSVYFYDSEDDEPLIDLKMNFESLWLSLTKDEDEATKG